MISVQNHLQPLSGNKLFAMRKTLLLVVLLQSAFFLQAQRKIITEQESRNDAKNFSYSAPVKKERYNIAVLSPLYLDSVDLEKNLTRIPKFMMPGIDFYQGVRIAADTLKNAGFKFNLFIYDSKSSYLNVQNLIESDKLDSMDCIIGNAGVNDLKLLADFAKKKKINFISAVSPSDANQEFNPYFTILQPRLASHIEKMHRHINVHHPEDNVVFIYRDKQTEINALNYYKNDVLNSLPLKFSAIEIKDGNSLDMRQIIKKIDSSYQTTIVLGTLDPDVTYTYLKELSNYASRFKLKVYCMPTSEAIKAFGKTDEFPGMPIYYTTSYIIDKITPASMYINRQYKKLMGSTPADIVYKGFESLYYFTHLLKKYGVPFNEKIGDNTYTFLTPYKIVCVKEKGVSRFYENKFMYLIRYEDGIMNYE